MIKKVLKILTILLFFIGLYLALYVGTDIISHMQFQSSPIVSLRGTPADVIVLIIAAILLILSIIQFAGDMAIKKHISNLIFLLPAILAGVLFTCAVI